MATVDVRDLLSRPTDSFERPPNLPNGHYYGTISNFAFDKARNENKTDFCRIFFKLEGPGEDLQADETAEEALSKIDFSRRELRRDFYITPDAMYRLRNFCDAVLGKEQGRSFGERLPELKGKRVLIQVTSRQDRNDPEVEYNDVGNVVAAD